MLKSIMLRVPTPASRKHAYYTKTKFKLHDDLNKQRRTMYSEENMYLRNGTEVPILRLVKGG